MTSAREQGTGNREQELRAKLFPSARLCAVSRDCPGFEECQYGSKYDGECITDMLADAIELIDMLSTEGLWVYCPDDEGHPRWKCSRCGKIVRKDPAGKLYCDVCGQRNRKEA